MRRALSTSAAGVVIVLAVLAVWLYRGPTAGEQGAPAPPDIPAVRPAPEGTAHPARADRSGAVIEGEAGGEAAEDAAPGAFDIDGLIQLVESEAAALKDRRSAAWKLARSGDARALAALEAVYGTAPPQLRAGIAEALGHCAAARAREMLFRIINEEADETALRGAVRGVAAAGGSEAVAVLDSILREETRPASVRGEAAMSLGGVEGPEAMAALRAAYEMFAARSDDVAEDALVGLGRRSIEETRDFFATLLDAPAEDNSRRVAALEALENATGDVGSFAVKYVRDSDPEVRAAAAWSIAAAEEPGDLVRELTDLLGEETEGVVRLRLYQALANQESLDLDAAFGMVAREGDAEARQAGLQMLAQHTAGAASDVQERFDAEVAPELLRTALERADPGAALSAVISLRQARTAGAKQALAQIAEQSAYPKVKEAAKRGL